MTEPTNSLIGCQCYFWQPGYKDKQKQRRIGIIEGILYDGRLKIRTGYGIERYYHYRKRSAVEVVQPLLDYAESEEK